MEESHKPEVGEIYIIKKNTSYTTWKITKVENKTVSYVRNDYEVSEKSWVDSINNPYNYTDTPISINKKEFNKKKNIYLINPNKHE